MPVFVFLPQLSTYLPHKTHLCGVIVYWDRQLCFMYSTYRVNRGMSSQIRACFRPLLYSDFNLTGITSTDFFL
jgi:hypothetical protein